jgi:hypothetical protein
MQYKTGTVAVENGSNVIGGNGTAWLANVERGDLFFLVGDTAAYEIAGVSADGSATLTAPFEGTSAAAAPYAISRDFTAFYGLPFPQAGDIGTQLLFKRAMAIIDAQLNESVKGSPPAQSVTTIAPPANPDPTQLWVVPPGATGAWAGQTNDLARWTETGWAFTAPSAGNRVWVADQTLEVLFTGTAWVDSTVGYPQTVTAMQAAQAAATTAQVAATAAQNALQTLENGTANAVFATVSVGPIGVMEGYARMAPVTGFTVTLTTRRTILKPAALLAAGTINMPAGPIDEQMVTVTSTQQITAVTWAAPAGATVVLPPPFLAPGTPVSFIYCAADTAWYPT